MFTLNMACYDAMQYPHNRQGNSIQIPDVHDGFEQVRLLYCKSDKLHDSHSTHDDGFNLHNLPVFIRQDTDTYNNNHNDLVQHTVGLSHFPVNIPSDIV